MLLTGHKTRAIFDRYDIIDEQELRTGDAAWARAPGPHPAPPLRLVRRTTA